MIAHSQSRAPRLRGSLAPELEPDVAHDQAHQDQEECEVEAGEEGRVPLREGRERGPPGDDQPDLVAVPHGPDRVQHGAALGLVVSDRAHEHPDPEVEALEHEVAQPQDRDEQEPDRLECRVVLHLNMRAPVPARVLARALLGGPLARVFQEDAPGDRRQHAVEQREADERGHDLGRADAGEPAALVFSSPKTAHGWRPISVNVHPVRLAMNGSTAAGTAHFR